MEDSPSSAANPDAPKSPDRPHPRVARARLAAAKDYQAHLCFARRARLLIDSNTEDLDRLLADARGLVDRYAALSDGHIEGRRRPPIQKLWTPDDPPRKQYYLCIDECGSHKMHPAGDKFPAFGLSGIFINDERYLAIDRLWRTWKAKWLGSPNKVVHEPDVRGRGGVFYRAESVDQTELIDSLDHCLDDLEFGLIAAVINKTEFHSAYGATAVDDFLPASQYLMCLDFIIERFVHFLYHQGEDARGIVIAESRGLLEDVLVQQEFVRLMVEGTQYHSASWFRYQLAPQIEFLPKIRNHTGLQLADLAARPCAEKALAPHTHPERWSIFQSKLYDGGIGRPESYGLKSFPTSSAALIFALKAEGDAIAPPATD